MWIIAPLTPGACRADREWHRREVAALEHELRNTWTTACLVTHLAQVMPPPGAILQVPTIGRITLDDVPARSGKTAAVDHAAPVRTMMVDQQLAAGPERPLRNSMPKWRIIGVAVRRLPPETTLQRRT